MSRTEGEASSLTLVGVTHAGRWEVIPRKPDAARAAPGLVQRCKNNPRVTCAVPTGSWLRGPRGWVASTLRWHKTVTLLPPLLGFKCILSGIKCQDLDLSKQCWEGDGGTFQRWGLVGCDFIHEDSALERDWCGFPVRKGVFLKTKPWCVPGFLTSQSSPLTVASAKNLSTMSEYS